MIKIGIIGAMEQEVALLQSKLTKPTVVNVANTKIYQGKIANVEVALIQSGIGKAMAAMSTSLLIDHAKPDFIINTGSAGGLLADMQIGDIAISTAAKYHDVDVTAFGYSLGQMAASPTEFSAYDNLLQLVKTISKKNIHAGVICSGDSFINDNTKKNQIKIQFPDAIAVDMEAAAIAHVCYAYQCPFIIIRAISDVADQESHLSFDEFLPIAASNSAELIIDIITILGK